tara:strand:- start:100 stop:771 length:672 start_codon:yes stop_codon:yes gene_type:complete
MKTNYTQAQKLVYKMLMTDTGKHFLDSGGGEGRNWQRNQTKNINDFNNEPEEKFSFDAKYKEMYREVSVFHYLSGLELDSICDKFNKIQKKSDNWDSEYYGVSLQSESYLDSFNVQDFRSWNTYNGESDLSQVLQGATMKIDGEFYYLIQIHGGADVRGGYTDAFLFKGADFCDGMIHEYLWEYKDSQEVIQDIREGYIETLNDYWEDSKIYTGKEVLTILND